MLLFKFCEVDLFKTQKLPFQNILCIMYILLTYFFITVEAVASKAKLKVNMVKKTIKSWIYFINMQHLIIYVDQTSLAYLFYYYIFAQNT